MITEQTDNFYPYISGLPLLEIAYVVASIEERLISLGAVPESIHVVPSQVGEEYQMVMEYQRPDDSKYSEADWKIFNRRIQA